MSRRNKSRPSKSTRNQAKWTEHKATQSGIGAGVGAMREQSSGSTARVMTTGSIQASPPRIVVGGGNKNLGIESPDPRMRGGIKLQPFTDVIPTVPSDYATVKSDHVRHDKMVWGRLVVETGRECKADEAVCIEKHGDKCEPGRVWERAIPDKSAMDYERVKLSVRPSHEAAMMAADRASGAEKFQSYAQRHEDDKKARLYRDGQGRIMRTTDMDESSDGAPLMRHDWRPSDPTSLSCEVDPETSRVRIMVVNGRTGERVPRGKALVLGTEGVMTTTDYAQMHSVPVQRNSTQRAHAAAKEKAERKAVREAEREAKAQARAQRKADKPERNSGSGAKYDRGMIDEAASLMLAKMGVTSPTRTHMRLAREAVVHQMQIDEYTGK